MKKEILYEINRYKEIMGLSLLSEGPGGPGISLLGIGKAMTVFAGLSDDIAKYLNDSKLLMALDDSSPLLTKYPILGDIRNTIQNEIGARDLVDNDIQYLNLQMRDQVDSDLTLFLYTAIEFIERAISGN